MANDQKDLSKLIDLLRRKGVKLYESDGVKLELLPEAPPSRYQQNKNQSSPAEDKPAPEYSDQDVAFWSSGQLPEEKVGPPS